jgi:class 3 adenylate cyclase
MHYRVWDSIVDGDDGDRVDYHGARLHAVIASPSGDPAAQIARAVALARKLTEAAQKVGQAHGFPSRIRFGIDHGKCLAMTTGRGSHEKTRCSWAGRQTMPQSWWDPGPSKASS